MHFGIHLSMSGRLADAPERGRAIGCRSLQVFCGNPRGWAKKPLDPNEAAEFREAVADAKIRTVAVHATYLINLASPDDNIYGLSVDAFLDELRRSAVLGARFYIVHSGSHKGEGEEIGRERIVKALRRADAEVEDRPEILLENTAGTSNSLGTTFEGLAELLDRADLPRTGICLDTCHALAAGYDLRTPQRARELVDELEGVLGLERCRCLHINDSKAHLGSRLDRHEHIGRGTIGDEGFQAFFGESRLWGLPAILETPHDDDDDDVRNLWHAVELAGSVGALKPGYLETMPTARLSPVGKKTPKPKPASSPMRGRKKTSRKKLAKKKPAKKKAKPTARKKRPASRPRKKAKRIAKKKIKR